MMLQALEIEHFVTYLLSKLIVRRVAKVMLESSTIVEMPREGIERGQVAPTFPGPENRKS
jgi:hypothetical protein